MASPPSTSFRFTREFLDRCHQHRGDMPLTRFLVRCADAVMDAMDQEGPQRPLAVARRAALAVVSDEAPRLGKGATLPRPKAPQRRVKQGDHA